MEPSFILPAPEETTKKDPAEIRQDIVEYMQTEPKDAGVRQLKLWEALKTKEVIYLEDWFKKVDKDKTEIDYLLSAFKDYYGKGKFLKRNGMANGPKRYVDTVGNIYIRTFKDDAYHGLCIEIWEDRIIVELYREGNVLLAMGFNHLGKQVGNYDFIKKDHQFAGVTPFIFLNDKKNSK